MVPMNGCYVLPLLQTPSGVDAQFCVLAWMLKMQVLHINMWLLLVYMFTVRILNLLFSSAFKLPMCRYWVLVFQMQSWTPPSYDSSDKGGSVFLFFWRGGGFVLFLRGKRVPSFGDKNFYERDVTIKLPSSGLRTQVSRGSFMCHLGFFVIWMR